MRAFVVDKYGKDGPRAAEIPRSRPADGATCSARVVAASINPLEPMTRNGEFQQLIKRKPPFVLGHDMAGMVIEVGASLPRWRPTRQDQRNDRGHSTTASSPHSSRRAAQQSAGLAAPPRSR